MSPDIYECQLLTCTIKRNQNQPYKRAGVQPQSPWRLPPFPLCSTAPLPIPEPHGIKHWGLFHGNQSEIPRVIRKPESALSKPLEGNLTAWAGSRTGTHSKNTHAGNLGTMGVHPGLWESSWWKIWKNTRQRGTCQGLVLKALHVPAKNHRITEWLGLGGA